MYRRETRFPRVKANGPPNGRVVRVAHRERLATSLRRRSRRRKVIIGHRLVLQPRRPYAVSLVVVGMMRTRCAGYQLVSRVTPCFAPLVRTPPLAPLFAAQIVWPVSRLRCRHSLSEVGSYHEQGTVAEGHVRQIAVEGEWAGVPPAR